MQNLKSQSIERFPLQATFELLVAAAFWGFGFIAARWALESLDATEVTFARFALAAAVGFPFLLTKRVRGLWRTNLRWSFLPGLLLFGTLIFQTWGLNYTTATKSGFITTLYVVFVPMAEAAFGKGRMPRSLWLCVLGAMIGTALIVNLGVSEMNYGDFLTLICAVLAAGQILWLGKVSPRVEAPFAFNIFQAAWAGIFCLPLVNWGHLTSQVQNANQWSTHTWIGLTSLVLGSTVIAFFLQVRAQKRLPPTVSSLIFLLESPFAMVFSLLLLDESFRGMEAVGAAMIFVSAMAATLIEARARAQTEAVVL